MAVYVPDDDSYLLIDVLTSFLKNKPKDIKILDMGTGSGIVIEKCHRLGYNYVLASDIDPEVITLLKKKGINAIKSDLFKNIKNRFDLIIFNPPYLPLDKNEPVNSRLQTTAGIQGYEIIIRFLNESIPHLKKEGTILLLFSSLSKPKTIFNHIKSLGLKKKLLKKKKDFF